MKRLLVLAALLLLVGTAVFAQTNIHTVTISIPAIAVIALDDDSDVPLSVTAPAAPGDPVTGDSDATRELFYTLICAQDAASISVSMAAGTLAAVPAGLSLTVVATDTPLDGTASPARTLTVGGAAQQLITSLDPGNTGTVDGNGAGLTYSLNITDATQLAVTAAGTLIVTYTIAGS